MHTDHRQPPLRALGVLVLFVAITLLAMRTGLAAPQAQAEEPSITPHPGDRTGTHAYSGRAHHQSLYQHLLQNRISAR